MALGSGKTFQTAPNLGRSKMNMRTGGRGWRDQQARQSGVTGTGGRDGPAGRGHARFMETLIFNELQNTAWKRSLILATFPRYY